MTPVAIAFMAGSMAAVSLLTVICLYRVLRSSRRRSASESSRGTSPFRRRQNHLP